MKGFYLQVATIVTLIVAVFLVLPGNAQKQCPTSFTPDVTNSSTWDIKKGDMMNNCTSVNHTCQYMFKIMKRGDRYYFMNDGKTVMCKENMTSYCPDSCTEPESSTTWTMTECTFCCQPGDTLNKCAMKLPKYSILTDENTDEITDHNAGSFITASTSLVLSFGILLLAKHLS